MNKALLASNHAIPGIVDIEESESGLTRAKITTKLCNAEVYLQGAHLTQWQPAGSEPVLFLSERTALQPGKAIRGGVPVIFPWFGARTATPYSEWTDGPSHGFARTSIWQLASATTSGDNVHLTLTLEPNEVSRSLGYDDFLVTYKLTFGLELLLQLEVQNLSTSPLYFEEALHSYFAVGDATKIAINGLADTEYLDKTDAFKRKRQTEFLLTLSGETDRPYLNTTAPIAIADPDISRRILIEKQNSKTTVIWNPWSTLTAKLADMAPDGWTRMVCVETANVGENAVSLAPGETHTMDARVIVKE